MRSLHICPELRCWSILWEFSPAWIGRATPLQYSCLENPMDGGAWWAAVHGVAASQTWLSDFTFTFHFHALEKEMATHSSVLAWGILGTGEPGGLLSMGLHRVGHDWSDLAAAAAAAQGKKKTDFSLVLFKCQWLYEMKDYWFLVLENKRWHLKDRSKLESFHDFLECSFNTYPSYIY